MVTRLALVEVVARGSAVVLLTLALVGSFEAVFRTPRRWIRWTADASYWIYLIHLPVVAWLTFWLAHSGPGGRARLPDRVRLERGAEVPGGVCCHRRVGSGDLSISGPLHPARHAVERQAKPRLKRPTGPAIALCGLARKSWPANGPCAPVFTVSGVTEWPSLLVEHPCQLVTRGCRVDGLWRHGVTVPTGRPPTGPGSSAGSVRRRDCRGFRQAYSRGNRRRAACRTGRATGRRRCAVR